MMLRYLGGIMGCSFEGFIKIFDQLSPFHRACVMAGDQDIITALFGLIST